MTEEKTRGPYPLRTRYQDFLKRLKTLQGDPHYIAMGMGIGVFVGVTPTIPFHTALALALAFLLKGSKPAAIIGVWFSNPITIPVFYWGSYKLGAFMLGGPPGSETMDHSMRAMLQQGLDLTIAMIAGGVILGVLPGIIAYFITLKAFTAIRSRRRSSGES